VTEKDRSSLEQKCLLMSPIGL